MILCETVPIFTSILYYKLRLREKDPLRATFIQWVTIAVLVLLSGCSTYLSNLVEQRIRHLLAQDDVLSIMTSIYFNNLLVMLLTSLLKEMYLGYVIATTALVAGNLSRGYPWNVVLGAHTLLELYSYSLALKGSKKALLLGSIYLLIAAGIESYAIFLRVGRGT